MSVADDYRRQFAWRAWPVALDLLPPLAGRTVLDLGCGVGDLAAELSLRGARVIGIDGNEELLAVARARGIANAEFRAGDLHRPLAIEAPVDGVWASFAAAYFVDLGAAIERWARVLRDGGFVALTEIDDLFAHEPLSSRARAAFAAYVDDALAHARYDFRSGRKLRASLERAGFSIDHEVELADRELAFDGPADPGVVAAWRTRLDRMQLLRNACGAEFEAVRDEFLACLARPDHRASARVVCCVARRARG